MNAIQRKPSHFQPCGCDKCTIESLRKQLATAKLEGFNEGIEAAANHALSIGKELNTVGYVREIRALKRECVSTTLEVK